MEMLRVNMKTGEGLREPLPDRWKLLGNRGLTAKYLLQEVDPGCEPLGEKNKLVFANGPLGSAAVSSGQRLSVGAKSPLTGGIKEANSGGNLAGDLARLGLRGLIVEGEAADGDARVLVVEENGARVESFPELRGVGVYETAKRLRGRFGDQFSFAIVGPAGELGYNSAGIMVTDPQGNPGRAAARGGLGAVMHRRGLKALAVYSRGGRRLEPENPDAFQQARQEYHRVLRENPSTGERFPLYGTAGVLPTVNALGGLPTRAFRQGNFEEAENIGGEALYKMITQREGQGELSHACMPGCLIRCSNITPREDGEVLVSPLEYETIAMVGSNLGIGDLDAIGEINYRCNDYGLDTIEIGVALGVAMDAGWLEFGDVDGVLKVLDEMAAGTVLGRVLGQGAGFAGRVFNVPRVPVVKNQGIAAHEPRAIKGMSITYAFSPMGADHTAAVTTSADVEHTDPRGQMELSRDIQVFMAGFETLGFCMFALRPGKEVIEQVQAMVEAAYGEDLGGNFLGELGKDVIKTERLFNIAAGLTPVHDRLPEFMLTEPMPPTNAVSDIPEEDYQRFWEESFWGSLDDVW